MYCQFYGLSEPPFNLTPNSKFLFLSNRHEEALAALVYGIEEQKGFICLSGEIGSGKTTLYRTLISRFDKSKIKVAVVLNSFLSDLELLQTINEQYGLPAESKSKKELLDELNYFLISQFAESNTCVLIIDEAQNLKPETLEQVRMISNLETETEKLIQIVLVGQPQLQRTLALPELEQLNQRIIVRHHVTPLSEDEVVEYIQHRLRIAKAQVNIEFTAQALRLIFHYSKGVPRRINVICDRVLLVGYVMSRHVIDGDMVQQAVEEIRGEIKEEEEENVPEAIEIEEEPHNWKPLLWQLSFGLLLFIILGGGVWIGANLGGSNEEQWQSPDTKYGPPKAAPEVAAAPPAGANGAQPAGAALAAETATPGPDASPAAGEVTPEQSPEPAGSPTPDPTPTAFIFDAWTLDRDKIVRVHQREHTAAASYITLLNLWGMDVELTTFAEAAPDIVARFDLPAMLKQLNFHTCSTNTLTEAIKLDLPMLIRVDPEHPKFPPCMALLKMQGELLTIADPINGTRTVDRKEVEEAVREIVIPYLDPNGFTGLKVGSAGEPVAQLQRIAVKEGEKVKEIDGKFGSSLRESLQAIQRKYKIPPTGEVDNLTAALLMTLYQPDRPRLYS